MANKFSPQIERVGNINTIATWIGAGAVPDSIALSASFIRQLVNDDDATNIITQSSGSIGVDGLRTDRSVQVGAGPTLTYKQISLYFLSMIADARANP